MAKLTKDVLIVEIARAATVPLKDAKNLLEIILESMVCALRKGEGIEVRGFGTFSTHVRAARGGRNPKTGAQLDVPAKRVPNFKPSRELRSLVNLQERKM